MKTALKATFALIFLIAVYLLSDQNVKLPEEEGRSWVKSYISMCAPRESWSYETSEYSEQRYFSRGGFEQFNFEETTKDFYQESNGIVVYDVVRTRGIPRGNYECKQCECPSGVLLYLQVSDEDAERVVEEVTRNFPDPNDESRLE